MKNAIVVLVGIITCYLLTFSCVYGITIAGSGDILDKAVFNAFKSNVAIAAAIVTAAAAYTFVHLNQKTR